MAFKFEKSEVWKESVELYILASQIKRAADSVSLNIAEGSTDQTNAEFRRFLSFAVRSGIEVIGCIYLARKRNLINEDDFNSIYSLTDSLVMRIQALKKSIPIK